MMVDASTVWKPSQTVVFTFDGQMSPQRMFICGNDLSVEVYTCPKIQCYNCRRYRHTKTQFRLDVLNADDPSADLHLRSIIESGWLRWHTIFTDASKLSEAECFGVGSCRTHNSGRDSDRYAPAPASRTSYRIDRRSGTLGFVKTLPHGSKIQFPLV
ncbi:hypothetical protein EVAR_90961_1 [Eumeta japonica]|uniref:Uncharacterized protein n=1 Tax=Eumeta variegata TaxID=151549 RepID=A0A4C1Z6Q3_EUMVA|nr:hypothetical protein EVAR_90961_1 [Eumeta japonica]